MLTVAISKRNKLQNIIVLTPKDGENINRKYLENMHKNRKIKLCKINKNEKGYGQIGTGLLF